MDIRNAAAGSGTLLLLLAAAAPAAGASLSFTSDPQPLPEASATGAVPLAIEGWATGSATLVPLMAADTPATAQNPVDAPATPQAVGKPVDDVSFVRRATESGRKEIAASRDALPQLKRPELKRMAEMLVQDHTAANAKLSKIAEAKGWPLPAPQASEAPPPAAATIRPASSSRSPGPRSSSRTLRTSSTTSHRPAPSTGPADPRAPARRVRDLAKPLPRSRGTRARQGLPAQEGGGRAGGTALAQGVRRPRGAGDLPGDPRPGRDALSRAAWLF